MDDIDDLIRSEVTRRKRSRCLGVFGPERKNLRTVLWRFPDRSVNLPGRDYWLKDQPFPDAGYELS